MSNQSNKGNDDKISSTYILVAEDAKGVADDFAIDLKDAGFIVTVCYNGTDATEVIEKGMCFDLAVIDPVMPSEDPDKYNLEKCQVTGIRLMGKLIENRLCYRFYIITARVVTTELQSEISNICGEFAIHKIENKRDLDPNAFIGNVKKLLEIKTPTDRKCELDQQYLVKEWRSHLAVLEEHAHAARLLCGDDLLKVVDSLKSITNLLKDATENEFIPKALLVVYGRCLNVLSVMYCQHALEEPKKYADNACRLLKDCLEKHAWQKEE